MFHIDSVHADQRDRISPKVVQPTRSRSDGKQGELSGESEESVQERWQPNGERAGDSRTTNVKTDKWASDEADDYDYSVGSIGYKVNTKRERDPDDYLIEGSKVSTKGERDDRTDGRISTHRVAENGVQEESRWITSSGLVVVYGVQYRPTDSHQENDS